MDPFKKSPSGWRAVMPSILEPPPYNQARWRSTSHHCSTCAKAPAAVLVSKGSCLRCLSTMHHTGVA
jgi:hypothetical protein